MLPRASRLWGTNGFLTSKGVPPPRTRSGGHRHLRVRVLGATCGKQASRVPAATAASPKQGHPARACRSLSPWALVRMASQREGTRRRNAPEDQGCAAGTRSRLRHRRSCRKLMCVSHWALLSGARAGVPSRTGHAHHVQITPTTYRPHPPQHTPLAQTTPTTHRPRPPQHTPLSYAQTTPTTYSPHPPQHAPLIQTTPTTYRSRHHMQATPTTYRPHPARTDDAGHSTVPYCTGHAHQALSPRGRGFPWAAVFHWRLCCTA